MKQKQKVNQSRSKDFKYQLPAEQVDQKARKVTYCKRKRGLLKKAVELSRICNQKIHISIFDENSKRLVQFNSHSDFNPEYVTKLLDP